MPTILLNHGEWTFNESKRLGKPSGFAEVFEGIGPNGPVAIKRLKHGNLESAAREIRVAANLAEKKSTHLIPVLDYGVDLDSDRYFIVMPICDQSLEDWLESHSPSVPETVAVGEQILDGLIEAGDLVHRDLKPSNILQLQGHWVIADFGIAKFAEESTSINTLKGAMTPQYASPEQWEWDRHTHKTDVYALGCILYRMVAGRPPFIGSIDECKRGHTSEAPPSFASGSDNLDSLILLMLRKGREGRPSLERCKDMLESVTIPVQRKSSQLLQQVSRQVEEETARLNAESLRQEKRTKEFDSVAKDGKYELDAIIERLFNDLGGAVPNAEISDNNIIKLGNGILTVGDCFLMGVDDARVADRYGVVSKEDYGKWHVAAFAQISVTSKLANPGYGSPSEYRWAATMFYSPTPEDNTYRWREAGFWQMRGTGNQPFHCSCKQAEFYGAMSTTMTGFSLAYGPVPIDGDRNPAFTTRWENLFAKAAQGMLSAPSTLPIPPNLMRALEGDG
jgi:serine/threonine-protein kinase